MAKEDERPYWPGARLGVLFVSELQAASSDPTAWDVIAAGEYRDVMREAKEIEESYGPAQVIVWAWSPISGLYTYPTQRRFGGNPLSLYHQLHVDDSLTGLPARTCEMIRKSVQSRCSLHVEPAHWMVLNRKKGGKSNAKRS